MRSRHHIPQFVTPFFGPLPVYKHYAPTSTRLCTGIVPRLVSRCGRLVIAESSTFLSSFFRLSSSQSLCSFIMDAATLFDVKGKVVLVTGGAKGIGRSISEGFVVNGAKVYISSRDAKACEQACRELNALGTSLPRGFLAPCMHPKLTFSQVRAAPTTSQLISTSSKTASAWSRRSRASSPSCTSWSTTPAPTGVRPTPSSPSPPGPAC